jgi:phosphoribosylformylglycinamidine synthase
LSEGGLAVAAAEMAFAGGIGADLTNIPAIAEGELLDILLFSESTTRFIVEVRPQNAEMFRNSLGAGIPCFPIGSTCKEPRLRIAGTDGAWTVWAQLADLKEAWQTGGLQGGETPPLHH